MNPGVPLELLNGNTMLLDGGFLLLIGVYLARETIRRSLRVSDWLMLRLPVSMHFAVAVAVHDCHTFGKSALIWHWRRFGHAAPFEAWQVSALAALGVLGLVGGLCKIRAISKPDYGDGPWLAAVGIAAAFTLVSLIWR
jgi:hypothetical protein